MDHGDVCLADFAPHVGSSFRVVHPQAGVASLELSGAEPLRAWPGAPRRDPFSLVFRGPASYGLPQGTFVLEHESLGSLSLFLVPIGPARDGRGFGYQAIFN